MRIFNIYLGLHGCVEEQDDKGEFKDVPEHIFEHELINEKWVLEKEAKEALPAWKPLKDWSKEDLLAHDFAMSDDVKFRVVSFFEATPDDDLPGWAESENDRLSFEGIKIGCWHDYAGVEIPIKETYLLCKLPPRRRMEKDALE